jgi:hypothetical protein
MWKHKKMAFTFLASTRLAVDSSFSGVTTVFRSTSKVYLEPRAKQKIEIYLHVSNGQFYDIN